MPPLPHPTLPRTGSLLAAMAERDHLLHPPYQSFDYVTRLINEAAKDPQVSDISITLYRVGSKSDVAKALLKAAKNGKQVTVVVELKARFDEESNMFWAEKLQKAGANVIYGIPELKVHSKLLLITRAEEGHNQLYAYLSTGNFNEETSQIYADHGLFTANPRLTREVGEVFRYFHDRLDKTGQFEHLLVAPFELREKLDALIDHEIEPGPQGRGRLHHSQAECPAGRAHDSEALRGQRGRRTGGATDPRYFLPDSGPGRPERRTFSSAASSTASWSTPASTCSATGATKRCTWPRPTG